MGLFHDAADVSVRPATNGDDAPITRVQLRAWRLSHTETLGAPALEQLDVAAVRERWTSAIEAPPSPGHRVLVACDGPFVVGFAATMPTDGGVELVSLEVDPDHQRGGHGSRLLAAAVDLARADGAQHLSTWVLSGDPAREQFLAGAGLGPDGAERDLAVSADGVMVTEHRWVAEI